MNWITERKKFQKQLQNHLHSALTINNHELKNKLYDNHLVIQGQKFLLSLEELKNILNKGTQPLLLAILSTATLCLENPTHENINALKTQYNYLKLRLEENKKSNKAATGIGLFFNSIYSISGFIAGLTGFVMMSEAMAALAGATASALVLATGPWGALALGLGAVMIGTAIAVIKGQSVVEEVKFLADKQTKGIGEFINLLDAPHTVDADQVVPEETRSNSYAFI
ncbi:Uncharacterised protein [Legionella beliardensis]|uniref:Transmembrane protein n=1 Tax=Legionella beliardensis TaxID=91822 RepID=A0A378I249_9GAMM|nr:hypothetical protein [Legionella beliardensis]STX28800.1 Uncharacterised protein [Legionella beliardensis]